jgi:hypothetical protein
MPASSDTLPLSLRGLCHWNPLMLFVLLETLEDCRYQIHKSIPHPRNY